MDFVSCECCGVENPKIDSLYEAFAVSLKEYLLGDGPYIYKTICGECYIALFAITGAKPHLKASVCGLGDFYKRQQELTPIKEPEEQ